MEATKTVSILKDYSEYPGPRYIKHGGNSGEDFYYKLLNEKFAEAVKSQSKLSVILDGTSGYASSFLDESFGNLVYDFGLDLVKSHLELISVEEPDWIKMIQNETFVQWEQKRQQGNPVKISQKQESPWYKYIDGKIEEKIWNNNYEVL